MTDATSFSKAFKQKDFFYFFKPTKDHLFIKIPGDLNETEKGSVVVVNAGNSSWKLGGSGLNGACNTLYGGKTWEERDIKFSLRAKKDTIGCDLIDDRHGFTHVYQVGPDFREDDSPEASKTRLHELLFSNYATCLTLTKAGMQGKTVILSGASTNIFGGPLAKIGRTDFKERRTNSSEQSIPNIVDYINALCFMQFSNQLKTNGLKIYMNADLSLAMKDIQEHQGEVLEWVAKNIPVGLLKNLGIEKQGETYKLANPIENRHKTFKDELLKQDKDYKEEIEIATVVDEIRQFNEGVPFSSLTNMEVKFWREKFEQLKKIETALSKRKFSEFLREAFEEVKKTHRSDNDGNRENINGLRHYLSTTHPGISEAHIFNPLFDEDKAYKELRFEDFNKYVQFLKDGGEGEAYRTQEDLAVMKELFERGFDRSKKEEFTTREGQKLIILTNEKGETFVIGDVGKKSETENTLQKYIGYLKEKYKKTDTTIKVLIPQTTGAHWTLLSATVKLPDGTDIVETTYDSMKENDPLGLGKRQSDGWSCGIHTMEAVSMVISGNIKEKREIQTTPKTQPEDSQTQPEVPQPKKQKPSQPEDSQPKTQPLSQPEDQQPLSQPEVLLQLQKAAQGIIQQHPEKEEVSAIVKSLAEGQLSDESLQRMAVARVSVVQENLTEQGNKAKEERSVIFRTIAVKRVLETHRGVPTNAISDFISGKISDTTETRAVKLIVESQFSALPESIRFPQGHEHAGFPCKNKIVFNEDRTTTVSFTFEKNLLSRSAGDGKCTVEIMLPQGVLASPDLLDAIREKKLNSYLEKVSGSSLKCTDPKFLQAFKSHFSNSIAQGQARE